MSNNKTKNTRGIKRRKYSYRRKNKNGTIRKVMRGCSWQNGGAPAPLGMIEVPQSHGGSSSTATTNATNVNLAKSLASLQVVAGNKPPVIDNHPVRNNFSSSSSTTTSGDKMSGGSYKSKHRRVRYKKSIGRKSRSRRFRKTKRH